MLPGGGKGMLPAIGAVSGDGGGGGGGVGVGGVPAELVKVS